VKARAIRIERTGGPEVMELVDIDVGEPRAGEVRVRHAACGINFIDIYFRSGLYPTPLPAVLGGEAAGTIDAVGPGVAHLAIGDRVGYAASSPGSYAEARVVDAAVVVKLPDALDFERAAAVMLKGLTVQYLLVRTHPQGGLHAGDAILWHAAAGGVGLIACAWAKALGLVLIGTAGGEHKCALARAHGAAHVIDYTREDIVARVRELTAGRGVKAVYDSVGRDTWERSLDCLAPLGLMVSFGNASGPVPPIDLRQLMRKGSLHVTRPMLGTHTASGESTRAMADELFAMIGSGAIVVPVPRRYALADAARAHQELESRSTTGAGVLVL
jgi:NADPH2:quinone reductase